MGGDAGIMVGIDHFAVLAHGHLLVELVALADGIAHEGGPMGIFQAHPAEAFGGAEQHILERAGFRFQIPVRHLRGFAAFKAGAKGGLLVGGHGRLLVGVVGKGLYLRKPGNQRNWHPMPLST